MQIRFVNENNRATFPMFNCYFLLSDFIQALSVGSTTLEGKTLNFARPNMVLWSRSTVCVHNVPHSVNEEEIFLRFESRKTWGRELDVRQVTPDKRQGLVYVTYSNERGKRAHARVRVHVCVCTYMCVCVCMFN